MPEQAPSAGVLGQFVESECAEAIGISSEGGVGSKLSAVARCLREHLCSREEKFLGCSSDSRREVKGLRSSWRRRSRLQQGGSGVGAAAGVCLSR